MLEEPDKHQRDLYMLAVISFECESRLIVPHETEKSQTKIFVPYCHR